MDGGFMYLTAVIDLFSRKVLSLRLSTEFCVDALQEALRNYGKPEIFNTDQGSQHTAELFTQILIDEGITISMDGKGRALHNIFVERLWRSIKYEEIYLKEYKNIKELKTGITEYFDFYNKERFHMSLDWLTPNELYEK